VRKSEIVKVDDKDVSEHRFFCVVNQKLEDYETNSVLIFFRRLIRREENLNLNLDLCLCMDSANRFFLC
jgi:hypothetical protein